MLGVATAALASLSVPAGQLAGWLGALPTAWIAGVARGFAGLPGAGIQAPPALGIAVVIAMAVAGIAWLVTSRRRQQDTAKLIEPYDIGG
jgi:competence protein ComEC